MLDLTARILPMTTEDGPDDPGDPPVVHRVDIITEACERLFDFHAQPPHGSVYYSHLGRRS